MKNPTIGLLLFIVSSLFIATATADDGAWFETLRRGKEKIIKFHFYVHDVRTGPNATLYGVADASITANSATMFGRINVFDDRVTSAPRIDSAEVARAQGSTTSADLEVKAYTMNMNFFITAGAYKGSTISIVGRNQFADEQRELTVAGGTGPFRYARGYAITSTYSHDEAVNYSVLEYTVYVISSVQYQYDSLAAASQTF